MIRLFFLGLTTLLLLITTIAAIVLVFSVIKWTKKLFSLGKGFINKQQQDWRAHQSEKDTPAFLREARRRLLHIDQLGNQLTGKWNFLVSPLIKQSHDLLEMGLLKPQQAEISRSFYTVTLKAIESFIEALVDMDGVMQDKDEEKARENIEVLLNDTYKYRAKFESKKRFDFHVMTEVIKQRFGK